MRVTHIPLSLSLSSQFPGDSWEEGGSSPPQEGRRDQPCLCGLLVCPHAAHARQLRPETGADEQVLSPLQQTVPGDGAGTSQDTRGE